MTCKICGGKGYTEYYHDAGDHFGAGQAPHSEWVRKPCPECSKKSKPVNDDVRVQYSPSSTERHHYAIVSRAQAYEEGGYIIRIGDSPLMHFQRGGVYGSGDQPLSVYENIIIALCKELLGDE
jgi:hypothetical protein